MFRWLFAVVTVVMALGLMVKTADAQPSTPQAESCQAAPIVPAPDFPDLPQALASPAASPISSPQAANLAVGADTAAAVEDVTRLLAACVSSGDVDGVAALSTAEFLGDLFGGGERLSDSDYRALAAVAPVIPMRIVTISEPEFDGMLTVGADVELVSGNQLRLERWTYLFREQPAGEAATPAPAGVVEGAWFLHRAMQLTTPAPEGAIGFTATLDEYTIVLSTDAVDGAAVVISGLNEGQEAHELLVLNVGEGADVDDLLRSTTGEFPASLAVAGQLTLPPGASGDLVLVDLFPGTYAVVCLFPDTSGIPHLAFGQQSNFTVT